MTSKWLNDIKERFGKCRYFTVLPLCWVLYSPQGIAEDTSLYDLSLRELLALKVSVASVESESIIHTPAIVSRYDLADVQRMGISRLEDLLTLIPGVVVKQGIEGSPVIIIRGITHFNNQKVLFLLDDVPYWDSEKGDFPLRGIPIEAIDHVEVIRGPGAIYYGTNATTGVIKVTTKKHVKNVATVTLGSNKLRNTSAYLAHEFNDQSSVRFAFQTRREDGYTGKLNNALVFDVFRSIAEDLLGEPPIPTSGKVPVKDEGDSAWVNLKIADFQMTAHYYEIHHEQISGILAPFTFSDTTTEGSLLQMQYQWQRDQLSALFFSDYTIAEEETIALHSLGRDITFFGGGSSGTTFFEEGEDDDAFRWRSGGTLNYRINQALSLFGGIEYERRSSADDAIWVRGMPTEASDFLVSVGLPDLAVEPFSYVDGKKVSEKSYYLQLDYSYKDFRFLVGARHTENNRWGDTTIPRFALVYSLDEKQSIKLLHSVGFNTPSLDQTEVAETGATVANPDLETEEIATTDLAYSFADKNSLYVANLYYFETSGLVQNVFASSTPQDIEVNLNLDVYRWGLELDYQFAQPHYKLFMNMAYHHQGNRTDNSEHIVYADLADFTKQIGDFTAAVVPRYTAVMGGHYTFSDRHSVGASWRYIGSMKGASATSLLNLNYRLRYTQTIELRFNIINTLDEDIVHPDDSIPPIEAPGGDGTRFTTSVSFHF